MQRVGHALKFHDLERGLPIPAIAQFGSLLQTFQRNISED
jgi:hypothetical protein